MESFPYSVYAYNGRTGHRIIHGTANFAKAFEAFTNAVNNDVFDRVIMFNVTEINETNDEGIYLQVRK